MTVTILNGDAVEMLRTLPSGVAQCCVTSPPYYGLRDYGVAGQIGLEESPDAYVARLVGVFREVRRVLRDDGTLWLNLGDSYSGGSVGRNDMDDASLARRAAAYGTGRGEGAGPRGKAQSRPVPEGVKPKDLLGIPWQVAFALRADGWWLRSAIVWHKPNPMPESVRDRPTSSYEMVFLLSKAAAYYYDQDAIREPHTSDPEGLNDPSLRKAIAHDAGAQFVAGGLRRPPSRPANYFGHELGRNARNVWTITPKPYRGAHFATMPPELAERCILAGCAAGDTVLDPFGGAGTTAYAAQRVGRSAILCELNPTYVALARERLGLGSADAVEGAAAARLALTAAIQQIVA